MVTPVESVVDPAGDPVVVVTAMRLSARARADLSELLGPGYLVVDVRTAPESANIVLSPVASDFALANLREMFPQARVLFAELHDVERGIRYAGPLSRIVASRPDGYFVLPDLESLGPAIVEQSALQLGGNAEPSPYQIGPSAGSPSGSFEGARHEAGGHVVWMRSASSSPGWVDLDVVDDLVRRTLPGAGDPRSTQLWAAVVAECAVHLARDGGAARVDVRGLGPEVLVDLKVRVASEGVHQDEG